MQISRRNALTGATAAVAVAAVPTTVRANDAHIEALLAECLEAERVHLEARNIADTTLFAAQRTAGPCPLDDLDRLGKQTTAAAVRSMRAWHAARAAAVERSDATELDRRADALHEVFSDAQGRLIAAPAQTPRGVILKMRGYYHGSEIAGIDDGLEELSGEYAASIYRDLERLAWEAPS